jgi:hypothetical protein
MRRIAPLLAILLMGCTQSHAQSTPAQDPVAGIVKLFDTYRIVMLGEIHGCTQEWKLIDELVAAPGFAGRVNDIVMEFGNARYQDVVDRYIAGDNVPIEQVERAWQDTVGAFGPASPGYGEFYAAVRAANRKLPKEGQIRILLGDPPMDWGRVHTAADREYVGLFLPFRDEFYASVVRYQVLAKKQKALLIMGEGHFRRNAGRPGFIERELLTAFVQPYVIMPGSNMVGGYDDLDPRFDQLSAPSLIDMKTSWVGAIRAQNSTGGALPETWVQMADAYLYLGPRDTITVTEYRRSQLDGTRYGNEVQRRLAILFDKPPDVLPPADISSVRPAFSRTPPAPPPLPMLPKPHP